MPRSPTRLSLLCFGLATASCDLLFPFSKAPLATPDRPVDLASPDAPTGRSPGALDQLVPERRSDRSPPKLDWKRDAGSPCAASCAGCCSGSLCVVALSRNQCGVGGAACRDCAAVAPAVVPPTCNRWTCNPATGLCDGLELDPAATCDDADLCTNDKCASAGIKGVCLHIAKTIGCLASECTTGVCDPATGQCGHKAPDTVCNGGAGKCCLGKCCTAPSSCTASGCSP